ncbi:hypothetical protein NQ317_008851 [Molorchus minor]|uniref:Reverse transcriptase domain-containing protein n=1 Tax=Molorchus minor TaxID=1323400 RepID=A0ABQ9IPR4_9CUCU|nr:hypothetical protein NQ317_008851 [Molorchus minor]
MPDTIKKQDTFISKLQLQVGSALSALAKPLNDMFTKPTEETNQHLEGLVNTGTLLCDVHHAMSAHRRYVLSPYVNSNIKKVIEETPVDKFLFGEKLPEKIKENKEIKRVAADLKIEQPRAKYSITKQYLNSKRPRFKQKKKEEGEGNMENRPPPYNQGTTLQEGDRHEERQTSLPLEVTNKYAGRLKSFFKEWKKLTSNPLILSWVKGIKIHFTQVPRQKRLPKVKLSKSNMLQFKNSINHLLDIGAIESCVHEKGEFLSSYFLRMKPSGDYRFILNLKKLNKFVNPPHFKLEDYRTVLKLLSKNAFLTSIDLKDAYFLINVSTEFRKYFRFQFNEKMYQFTSLPFGYSLSPYIFTKLMKPVLKAIRAEGIICVAYLDDFLLIAKSEKESIKNTRTTPLLTGWGAFCGDQNCHGFWSPQEAKYHINYLELLAAENALKAFTKNISNCDILLRVDNVTAISHINKMGGVRFKNLNAKARNIWKYCEQKRIRLYASYINSKENVQADLESRNSSIDTEYEISDYYFNIICEKFGLPEIDIFATHLNTKCKNTSPNVEEDYADGRSFIRQSFLKRNFPEDGIHAVIASISNATLKQYESSYKNWWKFCKNEQVSPFTYNLKQFIKFLNMLHIQGKSYSTINTCKSALSLVLSIDNSDEKVIKRFLKGIYNIKPQKPKYDSTWDTNLVLTYLEKLQTRENLSLQNMTLKLVTLLAIISAHRLQTFTKIKLKNIKNLEDRIEIYVPDRIKTSGKGRYQPLIIIPYLNERPDLCLAKLLVTYIERTKQFRTTDNDTLILTYKKPHHPASVQTISRWIKTILYKSGVDTSTYSSYSTRHAATSAAYRGGINIEEIRRRAGWSNKSNTFNIYYNKPVNVDTNTFARAVLLDSR